MEGVDIVASEKKEIEFRDESKLGVRLRLLGLSGFLCMEENGRFQNEESSKNKRRLIGTLLEEMKRLFTEKKSMFIEIIHF